jgi:hypothetical protein
VGTLRLMIRDTEAMFYQHSERMEGKMHENSAKIIQANKEGLEVYFSNTSGFNYSNSIVFSMFEIK